MTNAESKMDELFKLLEPLNKTQGEYEGECNFHPWHKGRSYLLYAELEKFYR
jgi:hypothetical protein